MSHSQSQGKGQPGRALQEAVQERKRLQEQEGKGLSSGKPQERALTRTGTCRRGGKGIWTCLALMIIK